MTQYDYKFLCDTETKMKCHLWDIFRQLEGQEEKDPELMKELLIAQEQLDEFYRVTPIKAMRRFDEMMNPSVVL